MIFCDGKLVRYKKGQIRMSAETYIDMRQRRVQVTLKRLDIGLLSLGIHRSCHILSQMAPGLDEVGVLGQRAMWFWRRTRDFLSL